MLGVLLISAPVLGFFGGILEIAEHFARPKRRTKHDAATSVVKTHANDASSARDDYRHA